MLGNKLHKFDNETMSGVCVCVCVCPNMPEHVVLCPFILLSDW